MHKRPAQILPQELKLHKGTKRPEPELRAHVPQRHGDDANPASFLGGPAVCRRYQISDMSLWRWLHDSELRFPQPAMRIRGRRYWSLADLLLWERALVPRGRDQPNMRDVEAKIAVV